MGARGPRAQPTKFRVMRGNPSRRRLNQKEPKPPDAPIRCPAWLDKDATKEWRRIAPLLKKMGVLSVVDIDALAAYCTTLVQYKKASAFVSKNGMTYMLRDKKGNPRCLQQFPEVNIARASLEALRSYQREFGMTPSARTSIEIPSANESTDEDAEWFGAS